MCADDFAISRHRWEGSSRPCTYSLALGDVAFADFSVDDEGRLVVVRISFDGYGCCDPDALTIEPMDADDSLDLIARLDSDEQLETDHVRGLLRNYFEAHRFADVHRLVPGRCIHQRSCGRTRTVSRPSRSMASMRSSSPAM